MATLCRQVSSGTTAAESWDAPYPLSPGRAHRARRAAHRLPLGRAPPWAPRGVHKCRASVAAALARRRHARGHARAPPGERRGTRAASLAGRGRGGRLCPLAQAAVRAWPRAAQVQASAATVAPRRPTGRGWTRSTAEPAGVDALGSGPRSSPPITGMRPTPCASNSAPGASGHSSLNGSGRRRRRVVARWARLAACFAAFLAMATIQIWLQRFIAG